MTAAISNTEKSPSAVGNGGDVSSVALQDQLARCTQQLGDWVACPSSKTPEGQKIIANLRAQIGNIESRLSASSTPDLAPASPVSPASSASRAPLSTLGSVVNVFT